MATCRGGDELHQLDPISRPNPEVSGVVTLEDDALPAGYGREEGPAFRKALDEGRVEDREYAVVAYDEREANRDGGA